MIKCDPVTMSQSLQIVELLKVSGIAFVPVPVDSDLNKRHDPYMPDWSKAPVWAEWHAFDKNGDGYFFEMVPYIDLEYPDDWSGDVMQQNEENITGGCPEFYMTLRRRPEDK